MKGEWALKGCDVLFGYSVFPRQGRNHNFESLPISNIDSLIGRTTQRRTLR